MQFYIPMQTCGMISELCTGLGPRQGGGGSEGSEEPPISIGNSVNLEIFGREVYVPLFCA